jgi:peptidoglycan/LPS O-acetylase OafA/YrhL
MGIIRFLLALCVVVTHAPGAAILGFPLLDGIAAVQCFYVISGFLITMVINEKPDYRSVGNFYISRYLRLWPIYIAVAALSIILFRQSMFADLTNVANWPATAFVAFSNLTLFFQDWFLFFRLNDGNLVPTVAWPQFPEPYLNSFLLVPQCWTIGVELTFYAIAPFICRSFPRTVALCLFGLAVRLIVASLHPPTLDPWVYRFAPSEMMLFGGGGVAYFVGRGIWQRWPRFARIAGTCAIALLAILILDYGSPKFNILRYPAMPLLLFSWAVLALMTVAVPFLYYASAGFKIDALIGELSYPMYVCHMLVGRAVGKWVPGALQGGNLLYVALVISFSILLLVVIGQPIDAWRRRFGASTIRKPIASEVVG